MEEAGFLFTDFYFNSLPHAEVDGVQQAINADTVAFQLTTSRRGRLLTPFEDIIDGEISTHYLTQR